MILVPVEAEKNTKNAVFEISPFLYHLPKLKLKAEKKQKLVKRSPKNF